MPSQWVYFPCSMGEKRAYVALDLVLAESIDTLPLPEMMKLRITLKEARLGLPTEAEGIRLAGLETAVVDDVERGGGVYAGRITVGGYRYLHLYVDRRRHDPWREIDRQARRLRYEVKPLIERDPDRKAYWEELYPTPDDLQVIKDIRVIDTLSAHGDSLTVARNIDHWAYFGRAEDARSYESWLESEGFIAPSVAEAPGEPQTWSVAFSSHGRPLLGEVGAVSLKLSRKARSLGGRYDGWGTEVETGED